MTSRFILVYILRLLSSRTLDAHGGENSPTNLRGWRTFGLCGISSDPFASSSFFLSFFFFSSLFAISYESLDDRNTRESRRDSRRYRTATLVKEPVLSSLPPLFLCIFFRFFFCNSMLSVRGSHESDLSSTSHYVRAKKISREFHTSFSLIPRLRHLLLSLLPGNREYFEITVCIKSPRTLNDRIAASCTLAKPIGKF